MATIITLTALIGSAVLYLVLGLRQNRRIRTLGDLIPVHRNQEAAVQNSTEFSASTVAATISLATVVLAIFELVPYLGAWLLWTVVTTAIGIFVVRLAARRIYRRLAPYGEHLPSLHEFLGSEYGSRSVVLIGAVCTSLGFLGAFAVELTVGSRFLAGLIPSIPPWTIVVALAAVGLIYTSAGGFRAVIVTDRIQMAGIWLLIFALAGYFVAALLRAPDGARQVLTKIPPDFYNFSVREGLPAFLIGIFIINVPTYLSDMSVWQRVSSSRDPGVVTKGLVRSIISVSFAWGALVILACLMPAVVTLSGRENPLIELVRHLSAPLTLPTGIVLFITVQGLYAAMLSTSSTQLIALSHTIHADIIDRGKWRIATDINQRRELGIARLIVLLAGALAVVVVEVLQALGFTIADLVFAIFGAQLSLFPPVLLALFLPREKLHRFSMAPAAAVLLGFVAGWASAVMGKINGSQNLVFLAPAVSLVTSAIILSIPALLTAVRRENSNATT